jgi:hypothetical protein
MSNRHPELVNESDSQFIGVKNSYDINKYEQTVNPAVLIGKLLYAVFIIGFMGYCYDRMVQAIRG